MNLPPRPLTRAGTLCSLLMRPEPCKRNDTASTITPCHCVHTVAGKVCVRYDGVYVYDMESVPTLVPRAKSCEGPSSGNLL